MQKINRITISKLAVIIFLISIFTSCIKDDDFKIPSLKNQKEYQNITSLKEIADLYKGKLVEFKDEITTYAYVNSSDREGNFYKSLFVQDAPENPTIGFEIKINDTKLNQRYAVGRKIILKLKGLFLNKNKDGSYQLGAENAFGNGIYGIGVHDYVKFIDRTPEIDSIIPITLKSDELTEKHQNILVKITDIQAQKKGLKYASPKPGNSIYTVDRKLVSCTSSDTITMVNSIFATYSALLIPDKKGSITGVFNRIENKKQLTIRDLNDVDFTQEYGCFNNPTMTSVKELRKLFISNKSSNKTAKDKLAENKTRIYQNFKIKVIITSDDSNGNITTKNAFAQDTSAGIALNFTDKHSLKIGDEIEITVGGLFLSKEKGLLTLNLSPSNISNKTSGTLPTPEIITIEQALTDEYQSKLIQIQDVQFKDITKNYQGENILTSDCTNELKIYPIPKIATFSTTKVASKKGTITGIMTQNQGVYIHINKLDAINFTKTYDCAPVVVTPPVIPPTSGTTLSDELFFSEYAKGSSNNKYIEIYNGTNQEIDMSDYSIELYINGATEKYRTLKLSSLSNVNLAKDAVLVVYNSKAIDAIKKQGDVTSSVVSFNGDDAIILKKNDLIIDVIGQVGEDPGKGWDVAGVTNGTLNHTLIRKKNITKGNTDWVVSKGTTPENSEWIVKDKDDFLSVGKK
ncbi:DUF5689 domain-containing protein [Tenacibaculum piscium]|uniref:DUF5689 domain-containing protein n=2 Tax=Tenacibaculum piscium TaxID=1458515 RepID=UPI001F1F056E|nr:DUF5689 domain-containing protein [Tenacibaculum piscium]